MKKIIVGAVAGYVLTFLMALYFTVSHESLPFLDPLVLFGLITGALIGFSDRYTSSVVVRLFVGALIGAVVFWIADRINKAGNATTMLGLGAAIGLITALIVSFVKPRVVAK